jgi:hypothetical protein
MQYLYDNSFGDWYGWNNPSKHALSLYPADYDPAHLNGASLTAAGRFHAQALWLASQDHAVHFEVLSSNADLPGHYDPRHTQVVAVVMDASKPVVAAEAEHGAKILFSSGDELRQRLLDAGLLEEMPAKDRRRKTFLCTKLARVNAVFNNIAYVIISADTCIFRACQRGPVCTCKWFCRHAGCEHVEYVAMLTLRLQQNPRHGNPQEIPATRSRGRKRESTRVLPAENFAKASKSK